MKLTSKQEAFAVAVASGMSQADAYRSAYNVKAVTKDEVVYVSASKLMNDPKITIRVSELRDEVASKAKVTLGDLLNEADEARELARELKRPSEMISATNLKAELLGFKVKRNELTGKDGKDLIPKQKVLNLPKDATPEQWEALARGLGAIGDEEYAV
jgi:phage terminase small subunit